MRITQTGKKQPGIIYTRGRKNGLLLFIVSDFAGLVLFMYKLYRQFCLLFEQYYIFYTYFSTMSRNKTRKNKAA